MNAEKKTLGLIGGGRGFGGGGGAAPAQPEFKVADIQTAYAVGLAMNLFNEENKSYMIKNLAAAIDRENKDDGGVMRPKEFPYDRFYWHGLDQQGFVRQWS